MRIATLPLAPIIATALSAATIGTIGSPAHSQTVVSTPVLQVPTGRGKLVTLSRPMSDLFVADPTIADVQVRSPTQLYVFAKKSGETTVSATARGGAVVYAATIRVGNNIDSIGAMLGLAMPDARIVATPMNGMVLLTGAVANPQDAAEAERLVQAFVGADTKVLSRLKTATPLQVNLRVRFAEVSRSFVKNIGVNLTNRAGGNPLFSISRGRQGTITTQPGIPGDPTITANGARPGSTLFGFPANTGIGSTLGLASHFLGMDILSSLDLGETIGQVSTLAEPNVTTLSGETATFLAGGEIPIPVSQGLGAVSVEFKQYGVSIAYTPTVLSNGRISLRVRPEVSQLTSQGSVTLSGTVIPALSTRRVETSAELGSGESLVIAGLLQNDHNNSVEKTPGIGDVPILGALFRSNAFQRNETELVIVITPYLVKPVNANDIVLPTDGYQAPTDLERVFDGKLAGGKTGGDRPKPTIAPPLSSSPLAPSGPERPGIGVVAPVWPAPSPDPDGQPGITDRKTGRAKKDGKSVPAAPGFSSN